MEDPGARRDHRPRRGFWARFADQETGPQKVLVGLAGTLTALATTVGGIYAVTNVVRDDTSTVATDPNTTTESQDASLDGSTVPSTEPSNGSAEPEPSAAVTTRPGQTLVAQGSPEADALVHAFVDDPGRRAELDVVVLAQRKDQSPQWVMQLWYNCHDLPEGQPPGEDLCDSVTFVFDDAVPSPTRFDNPLRIELKGLWADNRPTRAGYGARGLEIYPVPATP